MKREHSLDGVSTTTNGTKRARLDDIEIAQAIVRAARTVPGVSDIAPGHFALVATYGVHERVPGVALRRTGDDALYVEAHVSLDANAVMPPSPAPSTLAAGIERPDTHGAPVLLLLAEHIRLAIHNAIHALGLPPPARIDVVMDDMA